MASHVEQAQHLLGVVSAKKNDDKQKGKSDSGNGMAEV